jgi:hypothetical protein
MGCAVETSAAVMALLLLPFASAAFDYRNALDEDIATYILIGIAAVYFTATAVLLLLAVCCCFVKAGKPKQKPLQISNLERPSKTKEQLPTIDEDEEPFQSARPQQKRTPHRRVTRLRSDEEELITSEEGASLPPSPTETTATAPPLQPVRKAPDPRKKTSRSTGKATPPVRREPPRLPGAASPLEKTPETQRKETPHCKPPNELPPLRNTPPPLKKHEPAAAYDYYSTKLAPIQRATNKRLDSPRMQQRKKLAISPPDIALSSLPKREPNSPSNSSASEDLENFVSQLTVEEFKTPATFKKTHLDTMENKGFWAENTVGFLELRRNLEPLSRYWYQIGTGAKMPRERLQLLRKVCGQSHEDGLWKMCQLWLDFEPELTWDRVLEALRGREMGSHGAEVARDIGRKLRPDFSPGGGSVRTSTNSDKSITML